MCPAQSHNSKVGARVRAPAAAPSDKDVRACKTRSVVCCLTHVLHSIAHYTKPASFASVCCGVGPITPITRIHTASGVVVLRGIAVAADARWRWRRLWGSRCRYCHCSRRRHTR